MKILVFLLASACVCNATFLSLLGGALGGGSGGDSHEISQSTHGHGHGHYQSQGYGNSPKVIKVILDHAHSGGHTGSGTSYGPSGLGGDIKIFKVASESGYAAGANHGPFTYPSYAPAYSHGGSSSFSSQLNAILPQIIQLILDDNAGYGGSSYGAGNDLNSQLVSHFGHSGKVYIKRINGKTNSYYSGGHVVQRGVLKITRVEGAPHGFSSHGPPVHEHPPHNHGW